MATIRFVLFSNLRNEFKTLNGCNIVQRLASSSTVQHKQNTEVKQKVAISADSIPFSRAKIGPFLQAEPQLHNQFLSDAFLRGYLQRVMPKEVFDDVSQDLERFGERAATDLYELAIECERVPPVLEQYNAWGRRVDKIITTEAWKKMKAISAEEGLISIAYERKHLHWSRLHQIVKLYLYSPSAGLYTCPLAMTDGAAKTIEALSLKQLKQPYERLTTRNPERFWTAGQWMTERGGGSDVANGTETIAVPQEDGSYKLYGYKWFSSATDSDMTLTLARTVGDDGQVTKGTKGLSMFFLRTRDENGELNNIEVVKLKNKLGTKQLPTAELLLDGTLAYRVSNEGRGVPAISNVLTITRIHNSIASGAAMRRILSLGRDYGMKRRAFGKLINDFPLHIQTQARMELETRGCCIFSWEIARLLGRDDCGTASDEEKLLLRLLTPVVKLYTAKKAMGVVSEGLELFGGQGYIEDTHIPQILRDAQVTTIWEGTTNILSLDVLRATMKTNFEVLKAFRSFVNRVAVSAKARPELQSSADNVLKALTAVEDFIQRKPEALELAARDFAFSLGEIYVAALLLEHATWKKASKTDIITAQRWCQRDMNPCVTNERLGSYEESFSFDNKALVLDGYQD